MEATDRRLAIAVITVVVLSAFIILTRAFLSYLGQEFDPKTEWALAAAGLGEIVIVSLVVVGGILGATQYVLACTRGLRSELRKWRR